MGNTDFTYLIEITDGDKEIMKEMIDLFLVETPVQIRKMNEAFEAKEWNQLASEAHKLKPTLSYVGMNDLKATVQEIENTSRNQGDVESIPKLLDKIKMGYENVVDELNQAKKELSS